MPPYFKAYENGEQDDKPGYVQHSLHLHPVHPQFLHRIIICLARLSPAASSDLPESRPGRPVAFVLVLLRMGFTWLRPLPGGR